MFGQPSQPTHAQPQPAEPKPRHRKGTGRFAVAVYAGIAGLIVGIGSSGGDATSTSAASGPAPAPTVTVTAPAPVKTVEVPVPGPTVTVTAKPAGPSGSIPGDGMFIVGVDVKPGTYRSRPAEGGIGMCYGARLDKSGDIIDNKLSKGQLVMTIKASDDTFETNGCETWERVK